MKLIKQLEISNSQQIWRLLIDENDFLLIETRDVKNKEVFFSSLDIFSGSYLLKDFQFEEKFWLGIEAFQKGIIYFHSFPKPDMPNHKEIIAFDIKSKNILWHNQELAFLFSFEDIVYGYKQGFEGRYYYSVDIQIGEIIKQLNENEFDVIHNNYRKSETEIFSNYLFPEDLKNLVDDKDSIINDENIIGQIEAVRQNGFLFVSFNKELIPNKYSNIFKVISLDDSKELFQKVLDADIDKLALDTFFIYKEYLFLIVEKNNLEIYKIEK